MEKTLVQEAFAESHITRNLAGITIHHSYYDDERDERCTHENDVPFPVWRDAINEMSRKDVTCVEITLPANEKVIFTKHKDGGVDVHNKSCGHCCLLFHFASVKELHAAFAETT